MNRALLYLTLLFYTASAFCDVDLTQFASVAHEYSRPPYYRPRNKTDCPRLMRWIRSYQLPNPAVKYTTFGLFARRPLSRSLLIEAYQRGMFPWGERQGKNEAEANWCSPNERGVLMLDELHLSRSFQRFMAKNKFTVSFDADFEAVIQGCANSENRTYANPEETGTWITPNFIHAYNDLFYEGYAHSVEVWHGTRLVGGIYGVHMNGVFSAESMFYREANASKVALLALVGHLKARGITWIDVKAINSFTEGFGAKYIGAGEYDKYFMKAQSKPVSFYRPK